MDLAENRFGRFVDRLGTNIGMFEDLRCPKFETFLLSEQKNKSLLSGHAEIADLQNHQIPRRLEQRAMVQRYVAGNGQSRLKGGKDLKRSQAYPRGSLGF